MTRLQADAILLLTAIIWGTAFIAQKIANDVMGPLGFVGARFLVSAIVLVPFALVEARKKPAPLSTGDYGLAVIIGVLLSVAGILQQIAMVTSSAAHGGFLTALYVVLVPFAVWILTRERVRPLVVIAGLISISGAWLLTNKSGAGGFVIGDIVLLVADVVWAFWIALIAIFQKRIVRPYLLAFIQFAITAAVSWIAAVLFETTTWTQIVEAMPLYRRAVGRRGVHTANPGAASYARPRSSTHHVIGKRIRSDFRRGDIGRTAVAGGNRGMRTDPRRHHRRRSRTGDQAPAIIYRDRFRRREFCAWFR
jgi:drug/metabolite transporter (DMT)-like permease